MECAALLRSFGINCTVVDFFRATGQDGTHPELLDWVWNYFSAYSVSSSSSSSQQPSMEATTLDNYLLRPSSSTSPTTSTPTSTSVSSSTSDPSTTSNSILMHSQEPRTNGRRPASLYTPTFIPPMFLQHEGHSRTIVGIEKRKNGTLHLLILGTSIMISFPFPQCDLLYL